MAEGFLASASSVPVARGTSKTRDEVCGCVAFELIDKVALGVVDTQRWRIRWRWWRFR
jgi:hypothetical protein